MLSPLTSMTHLQQNRPVLHNGVWVPVRTRVRISPKVEPPKLTSVFAKGMTEVNPAVGVYTPYLCSVVESSY